jgi:hypothetical protein
VVLHLLSPLLLIQKFAFTKNKNTTKYKYTTIEDGMGATWRHNRLLLHNCCWLAMELLMAETEGLLQE